MTKSEIRPEIELRTVFRQTSRDAFSCENSLQLPHLSKKGNRQRKLKTSVPLPPPIR
jgi:hypothetical protein